MQHPDNRPANIDGGAFKLDDYDLARVRAELDDLPAVDGERLCLDRLHRAQAELQKRDLGRHVLI